MTTTSPPFAAVKDWLDRRRQQSPSFDTAGHYIADLYDDYLSYAALHQLQALEPKPFATQLESLGLKTTVGLGDPQPRMERQT